MRVRCGLPLGLHLLLSASAPALLDEPQELLVAINECLQLTLEPSRLNQPTYFKECHKLWSDKKLYVLQRFIDLPTVCAIVGTNERVHELFFGILELWGPSS